MPYDPPWNVETLKEKGFQYLLKDPCHLWRAETGIELIHKEPTVAELIRIWNNWNEMSDKLKQLSDKKSLELFGCTNKQNYERLLFKEYISQTTKKFP